VTAIVILFAFVMMIVVGKMVFTVTNDDLQADDDVSNSTKTIVQTSHDRYSNLFDGLFVFAFILVWCILLVASFMIDTHPIFFIFTVLLLIFVFVIGVYLGNAYEEVTADGDFATVASSVPMTDWIMSHLLIVIIVIAFSVVIVLFAKSQYG